MATTGAGLEDMGNRLRVSLAFWAADGFARVEACSARAHERMASDKASDESHVGGGGVTRTASATNDDGQEFAHWSMVSFIPCGHLCDIT